MRFSRLLAIFLLAFALAAPGAMADKGGKGKGKDKVKHSEKDKDRDRDWDRDRDRDRDWDDGDWDGRDGNMRFRGMDRNGDGVITRREWRGNDVSFDNHDRNNDGVLAGAEVRPGGWDDGRDWDDDDRDRWWQDRFGRLDRNDDGHLSKAEWPGDLRTFDRADLNNDGLLSLREIAQWRRDRMSRR